MSTRAYFVFRENYGNESNDYIIYMHGDGYPSNALKCIEKTFTMSTMKAPEDVGNFEASELSAAFVAANKDPGGWIYIYKEFDYTDDWTYELELIDNILNIKVHMFSKEVYNGSYVSLMSGGMEEACDLLEPG